jgi:hypothetical protein
LAIAAPPATTNAPVSKSVEFAVLIAEIFGEENLPVLF